ncbi:MAG: penicillin-binding protein 1C [Helicobacteraceae bacterium]|jgi:penicillin-binding protein 1C|nr:penicillin-binding protein 1C [Helicobacteraceae bacterium]
MSANSQNSPNSPKPPKPSKNGASLKRRVIAIASDAAALIAIALAIIYLPRVFPKDSLQEGLLFSVVYYDKEGDLMRLTLAKDDRFRVWTPLDQTPQSLIDATLLREDRYFYYHLGFNPFSLIRGAWVTYVKQGDRQGGSTLTMQLVRMRYKLNTKTIGGKIEQIARAVWLEMRYSKSEILEAYLNYAPYGRNIEGAGTASLIYFDKPLNELAPTQTLALAVLPQSPSVRIDKNTSYAGEKLFLARKELFAAYREKFEIDDKEAALFDLPFKLRRIEDLPFRVPHLIESLAKEDYLAGRSPRIVKTTIESDLQTLIETQIKNHIRQNAALGVDNAAAVLVDTRDMSVVAAAGSADYFNDAIYGQIDGLRIKRSPGSALKPFIYALAIDQGIIHPQSVLKDMPTAFGVYEPENFDGGFMGPISARQALTASRNIPAVYLANRLSEPDFYDFLKSANIGKMASREHYGLALALGGGEVTPLEVAKLYAILANGGILREVRTRADQPLEEGKRLLSREASFIVLDMLSSAPKIDGIPAESDALPIYWKTGTSRAFRDAWCAGLIGHYALVIWVGSFDNRPNPALVGASRAAPLFFTIARSVRHSRTLIDPARAAPPAIKRVEVCLSSGDLATAWCKRRGKSWFIPGVSPIKVDTVYRPVWINRANGKPLCAGEDIANGKMEIYEFYASDIMDLFRKAGLPKREPPDMRHCAEPLSFVGGEPPAISSPLKNANYAIRLSKPNERQVVFSAASDAQTQNLYWFVGDEFIGAAKRGEILSWEPARSGRFTVRVIDDRGRSDMRELKVLLIE